jgi:hypothetical protein
MPRQQWIALSGGRDGDLIARAGMVASVIG